MGSYRTKEDDVAKISTSIFVTNFPDSTSAKDLFILAKHMAMSWIRSFRPRELSMDKSKGGLRVNTTNPPNHSSRPGTTTTSFASAIKGVMSPPLSASPALVLDDTCVVKRNLGNFVMGEVKNFSSINNIHILLANEGFPNAKCLFIWGRWVSLELPSHSSKDKNMKPVLVFASWLSIVFTIAQPEFVSRERIVWVDIEGVPLHV
ncbi:hypothetical protein Tco_0729377, partial [Tanacetum coccineum]